MNWSVPGMIWPPLRVTVSPSCRKCLWTGPHWIGRVAFQLSSNMLPVEECLSSPLIVPEPNKSPAYRLQPEEA